MRLQCGKKRQFQEELPETAVGLDFQQQIIPTLIQRAGGDGEVKLRDGAAAVALIQVQAELTAWGSGPSFGQMEGAFQPLLPVDAVGDLGVEMLGFPGTDIQRLVQIGDPEFQKGIAFGDADINTVLPSMVLIIILKKILSTRSVLFFSSKSSCNDSPYIRKPDRQEEEI